MKRVRDLMITDVITVDAESSVSLAAKLMKDHQIGAVIILEEDKIVGIFSERDLVNRLFSAIEGGSWGSIQVKEVMSKDLLTASPNQSCVDLINSMNERAIRHVPVVEEEQTT